MSSTLAPPGPSAAKRYSNMFRNSRHSMLGLNNQDDANTPSFFNDLAFLEETGGLASSSKSSKPVKLRPLRKNKEKTHSSKSSASSFLKKGGTRRSNSVIKTSKAQSITTTTTTTFVEYPYYEGAKDEPAVDLTDSITEASVELDESPSVDAQLSSDSEGGVGFFNDLQFLEAQHEIAVKPKSPKTKTKAPPPLNAGSFTMKSGSLTTKSSSSSGKAWSSSRDGASLKSSSSSTFTRFRTPGSGHNSSSGHGSTRSRTSSLKSSISINTLTTSAPPRRTSTTPSHISVPSLPPPMSPPPSLATHSSSPSLSSTMLPSPSGTSRQGSGSFNSTKVLPALPMEFSVPEGDIARIATFGREHANSRPSARYIFDPPSPQPAKPMDSPGAMSNYDPPSPVSSVKFPSFDSSPRSPRGISRPIGGPIPPPKHVRQRSANYQAPSPEVTIRPPRHSSLNATSSSNPATPPATERLNRASLSAVLAREESRRSSRSSAYSSSSPVSPTAEDLALLPTAPFSRLALSSSPTTPPVPQVPSGLAPPISWGRQRRSLRNSVLSSDGGPTSPCHSIIAAFPTPPEVSPQVPDDVEEEDAGYSSLSQTLATMQAQLYPNLPLPTLADLRRPSPSPSPSPSPAPIDGSRALLRPRSIDLHVRPESDAFTFDDDYWLATPSVHAGTASHRSSFHREESASVTQPLRFGRGNTGANGAATPSSPALLTPELMYPAMVTPTLPLPLEDTRRYKSKKTSSMDFDINTLIEHARPESATLPDFVNVDREGSLKSMKSTHVVPSEDGTDYCEDDDHEEVLTNASDDGADRRIFDGGEDDESNEGHEDDEFHEVQDGHESTEEAFEHDDDDLTRVESGGERLLKVDGSDIERADTPTSQAARIDAFLALESLASAAGYRLVRASFVPPREEDEEASTPTTPTPPAMASTPVGQS